jgi:chaperonin GroEL (HSP60 family)
MMSLNHFIILSWNIFQYFVEAGAVAVRRVRKEDLRHVAKATGATMVYLHDKNWEKKYWQNFYS